LAIGRAGRSFACLTDSDEVGYGLRAATLTCGWAFLVLGLLALLYGLGSCFDGTAGYFRFGIAEISKKKTYTAAVSFLLKERKKKGLFPQILIYLKKKKHSGII
jgi:hypothetical protein